MNSSVYGLVSRQRAISEQPHVSGTELSLENEVFQGNLLYCDGVFRDNFGCLLVNKFLVHKDNTFCCKNKNLRIIFTYKIGTDNETYIQDEYYLTQTNFNQYSFLVSKQEIGECHQLKE